MTGKVLVMLCWGWSPVLHLEGVGDHDSKEPNCGADTPGRPRGPASVESAGGVDHSQVAIYADTEEEDRESTEGRRSSLLGEEPKGKERAAHLVRNRMLQYMLTK